MPDSRSEAAAPAGPMQVGLLLETVQQQQQQVERLLQRLELWSADLDGVLRESMRHALLTELQAAGEAARHVEEALHMVRRQAAIRIGIFSLGLMLACNALPAALAWLLLPSRAQVTDLRSQYAEMTARVQQLKEQGGRIDIRRCGAAPRLCVRVDRKAPAYGDGDYLVVKGY